jgi:uncharacterized protein RhaS with RHS repeats
MAAGENGKNLIETIIENGYNLTKNNLISLIEKDIWINDNFILDEWINDKTFKITLSDICNKKNTFHYGVKPSIIGLIELVTNKAKLNVIKEYIKKNGIEPNYQCYMAASKHRSYLTVANFIEKKLEKEDEDEDEDEDEENEDDDDEDGDTKTSKKKSTKTKAKKSTKTKVEVSDDEDEDDEDKHIRRRTPKTKVEVSDGEDNNDATKPKAKKSTKVKVEPKRGYEQSKPSKRA